MVENNVHDVVVIGAGPAGIATAVEAKLAGIERVLVLEKAAEHSQTIRGLYTAKKAVDTAWKGVDVPAEGALSIEPGSRDSVLARLDADLEQHALDVRYGSDVWQIKRREDGRFAIGVSGSDELIARTVVVAIGVFGRPRKPDYKIPRSLKAKVHFSLTTRSFAGERVLVVGGGDSASEAVQYLAADNTVTLSYRRGELTRMNPKNRDLLLGLQAANEARLLLASDVVGLAEDEGGVRVSFSQDELHDEVFDHVVYQIGGADPSAFLAAIGLELEGKFPTVDASTFESALPGLYIAGDLGQQGKGSIVSAFNSGHSVVNRGLCEDHLECPARVGPDAAPAS